MRTFRKCFGISVDLINSIPVIWLGHESCQRNVDLLIADARGSCRDIGAKLESLPAYPGNSRFFFVLWPLARSSKNGYPSGMHSRRKSTKKRKRERNWFALSQKACAWKWHNVGFRCESAIKDGGERSPSNAPKESSKEKINLTSERWKEN